MFDVYIDWLNDMDKDAPTGKDALSPSSLSRILSLLVIITYPDLPEMECILTKLIICLKFEIYSLFWSLFFNLAGPLEATVFGS